MEAFLDHALTNFEELLGISFERTDIHMETHMQFIIFIVDSGVFLCDCVQIRILLSFPEALVVWRYLLESNSFVPG